MPTRGGEIGLGERSEDGGTGGGGDTDTGVGDGDSHQNIGIGPFGDRKLDPDLTAVGELDRVVAQIVQDLPEPHGVSHQGCRGVGIDHHHDLDPLLRRRGTLAGGRPLEGIAELELAVLQLQHARLDLGEVQDVVDQRQQGLAGLAQALGELALTTVQVGVEEEIVQTDHAVHRGTDLVAHGGQEVRLHGRSRHGLVPGLPERAHRLSAESHIVELLGDLSDQFGVGQRPLTVLDEGLHHGHHDTVDLHRKRDQHAGLILPGNNLQLAFTGAPGAVGQIEVLTCHRRGLQAGVDLDPQVAPDHGASVRVAVEQAHGQPPAVLGVVRGGVLQGLAHAGGLVGGLGERQVRAESLIGPAGLARRLLQIGDVLDGAAEGDQHAGVVTRREAAGPDPPHVPCSGPDATLPGESVALPRHQRNQSVIGFHPILREGEGRQSIDGRLEVDRVERVDAEELLGAHHLAGGDGPLPTAQLADGARWRVAVRGPGAFR